LKADYRILIIFRYNY